MRVYISGPITGVPDYRDNFARAEEKLTALGHKVVNPAKIDTVLPDDLTYDDYMTIDFALLMLCDAIYLLQGWENSNGALKEVTLARKIKLKIMRE